MGTNDRFAIPYEITADPGLDPEIFQEEFCRWLGIPSSIPVAIVIQHIIGGLMPGTPEYREKINFTLAVVKTLIQPSIIGAQLAVQCLQAHQLCTKMLRRAADAKEPEVIESYINIAMKLSRGFKAGLDPLMKILHVNNTYNEKEEVMKKNGNLQP